jgi:tetratricopeptide (TPR) repeat protein
MFWVAATASAQEVEVDRYNINARIDLAASALEVRAGLDISNLGQSSKTRVFLRLTKLAKVSAASVNGAPAQFEVVDDRRVTALNQIVISPQTPIAPAAKARIEVNYRVEAPETASVISVYPGEVLMTPEAMWFPMPSTMFTMYGATTAPFTLTVSAPSGFRVGSSGSLKVDGSNFTFDQPLNSLPLFVAGSFDQPVEVERGGIKVEFYLQPGLRAYDGKAAPAASLPSVVRLSDEAARVIEFYTSILGPPPPGAGLRVISSVRAGNLSTPGALVLNQQVFRRDVMNAGTLELLADALARLWLDGRVRVRGQEARSGQGGQPGQKARSTAFLRDSLPRYLAALYFEHRFGSRGAREAFNRMRWSYTPVAQSRRDAELGLQTISSTYGAAVYGKGPLVLRLMAETAGRDKFLAALKTVFSGPQSRVVTPVDFRDALVRAGGPELEKLFQQWVESIIEPDIVVGLPQAADKPGAQRVNLRNLGTGDVSVQVLAVTASGKRLTAEALVPSEDLTSVEFQTDEKITSVEVDPDKLIIQTNYDNDARPPVKSAQTLLNESIVSFNRGEYAEAEAKLREAVASNPDISVLRAWLARTLASQKKNDAAAEANSVLKIEPAVGSALGWAYITLGQVALAAGKAGEAVEHLRRGLVEAEEAPAQFAVREALVKAERGAQALPPVDESVRAWVTQLDAAIKQPTSDKLFTLAYRNNLKRFVQGITVTPPTSWVTEVLRGETVDANRLVLDVGLKVRAGGRDQAGTAVFVLHRSSGGWMLEDVQLFNVK